MVQVSPRDWNAAIAGAMLTTAIAAAGTAAIFPNICETCGSARQHFHVFLALAGGIVYSVLLALLAITRTRMISATLILFGAGFQLVLLKSMFDSSAWCASCTVAGASVMGASFVLVVGRTVSPLRCAVVPVAGIAAGLLLAVFLNMGDGPIYDSMPAEYQPLLLESKDLCRTPSRANCVVIFERGVARHVMYSRTPPRSENWKHWQAAVFIHSAGPRRTAWPRQPSSSKPTDARRSFAARPYSINWSQL